jgi:hypothetical protein
VNCGVGQGGRAHASPSSVALTAAQWRPAGTGRPAGTAENLYCAGAVPYASVAPAQAPAGPGARPAARDRDPALPAPPPPPLWSTPPLPTVPYQARSRDNCLVDRRGAASLRPPRPLPRAGPGLARQECTSALNCGESATGAAGREVRFWRPREGPVWLASARCLGHGALRAVSAVTGGRRRGPRGPEHPRRRTGSPCASVQGRCWRFGESCRGVL